MDKPLVGSEIHGFHTMQDLDVDTIMEEAKGRWLRPKEIHALLYNYKYFTSHVKPVNLPPSGTIVLFDRKMLRNFRKDGHNWKKRKDGKTVKESHEHLKVGDEERIDVYYAHGEDSPTFVRRCYWLLDKTLEDIVLVHYRETQEAVAGAALHAVEKDECSVAPPGSVAASKMKHEKADKVNQGNARLKNLRVRKLIQKARTMRKRKVEEDHETVTFTWRINSFSKLYTFKHYSEIFSIGDFKWRILMYPKGNKEDHLSVYLDISSTTAFPLGWSKYAKFSLTLVNQLWRSKSITKEIHVFKDCEMDYCGFKSLVPLGQFYDYGNGYIVNDICIIEAKVAVRKDDAKILQDHGISACMEPLEKEKEGQGLSNAQPVNLPDISAQLETPCCEQVPASYHSAPIFSEQIGTDLPNISIPKGIKDVLSTSADELMDFRGLAKIEKAFVPLLDEVCSCHSSLIKCQMKRSLKFKEWAFTALGRVLHFLKTKKVKDMTDDVCAELECLWEELQAFKFDLAWLKPYVERALCVNKLVKREVQSLRKGVDELEIEKKRLMAKLEVARRELEKVEGIEKMDMDKVLGYGGWPFCGILNFENCP